MLKHLGSAMQFLFGLALFLLLLAGTGWLVYTSITEAPGVVAAAVTAVGAVIGLIVQRVWEQQRDEERRRRDRMAPMYESLIEVFYRGAEGEVDEVELKGLFQELAKGLVVWGSPAVIDAFILWRTASAKANEDESLEALFAFEQLMFAIRSDLGHEDKDRTPGGLLRVFVNDIDEHLPSEDSAPEQLRAA